MFIPTAMWTHYLAAVSSTRPIVFGGMITHLATLYGFQDNEAVPSSCLLTIGFLQQAHDVAFYDRDDVTTYYKWGIFPTAPRESIIIPSPVIPLQLPIRGRPHYCLPGAIPPHYLEAEEAENAPPPHVPTPPHVPPHVTPPASPVHPPSPGYQFSPFETQMLEGQQQMLASLNQLTLHSTMVDDRLNSLDRRVGQLESDQRAILGPMYTYFNQQGYFRTMNPPPQPPSWYTSSQWGDFGGRSWDGGAGVGAGAGQWGGWSNIGSGSGAAEDTAGGDDDQGPESPGGSWDHHLH